MSGPDVATDNILGCLRRASCFRPTPPDASLEIWAFLESGSGMVVLAPKVKHQQRSQLQAPVPAARLMLSHHALDESVIEERTGVTLKL
jgi:hypothetical protein